MQLLILSLIVFSAATTAAAQSGVPSGIIRFPPGQFGVALPSYGPSTSVIDRNGNLLVFDVQYSLSPPAPPPAPGQASRSVKVTTRLTVITPNGTAMPPIQYDGAYQVIGAGWYAVYAITNNAYAVRATFVAARTLVAFDVTAGVPRSPLPTLEVPIRADVKLSAARDAGASDIISFVDIAPNPLVMGPSTSPTAPAIQRFARIVNYSGGANFSAGTPIPLP